MIPAVALRPASAPSHTGQRAGLASLQAEESSLLPVCPLAMESWLLAPRNGMLLWTVSAQLE